MKSFNEKIRKIGFEASNWLLNALQEGEFIEVTPDEDVLDIIVFDGYGEPYQADVEQVFRYGVYLKNGGKYYYDEMTNQSVARIADFVAEKQGLLVRELKDMAC